MYRFMSELFSSCLSAERICREVHRKEKSSAALFTKSG